MTQVFPTSVKNDVLNFTVVRANKFIGLIESANGVFENLTVTDTATINNLIVPDTATINNLTVSDTATVNNLTVTGTLNIPDGSIDLTTKVTGILPIANGGTNSGTALNNNRAMISVGGQIVESNAFSDGFVLGGAAGLPPQPIGISSTISSGGRIVVVLNPYAIVPSYRRAVSVTPVAAGPFGAPITIFQDYVFMTGGALITDGVQLPTGASVPAGREYWVKNICGGPRTVYAAAGETIADTINPLVPAPSVVVPYGATAIFVLDGIIATWTQSS